MRRQVIRMAVRAMLVLCLLVAGAAAAAVPATPQPRQLTVADGLPSNTINGFAEDAFGYMWLASGDGLARYDGRGYRIWRIEDGLRDNMIWAVHVDARNRVWIGTENAGLVMLSADRRRFHYYDHRGYPQMLGNTVWCIESTPDGSIWFGTSTGGLYRLTPAGKMERYMPSPGDERTIPAASVNFLKVGPDGTLWVAAKNGVARWTGHDFERLVMPGDVTRYINGLAVEADGSLWIADSNGSPLLRRPDGSWDEHPWRHVTDDSVLSVLLRDSAGSYWLDTLSGLGRDADGELRNVPLYSSSAHGLVKPNWSAAYEDHEGGIWFASPNTGLWHLPANWRQFAVLANRRDDDTSIGNPYVLAAARAADGRFWLVGTRGMLDRLDPATGVVEHHLSKVDGLKWPQSVLEDRQGRVWIGLYKALVRYDPADHGVLRWRDTDAKDAAMLGEAEMIRQTPDGRLWLYSDVDGIQLRDPDGHVLRTLAHDAHGLSRELAVNEMRVGPDGNIWLATSRGLLRWNEGADTFVPVPGAPTQAIYASAFTDTGITWLAGMGQVSQYFWDGKRLQLLDGIGAREDFPALEPGGMVVDAAGVAWVSSMRGLIRIDPANRAIRIYGVHDGLPNQQFRPRTLLQSRLGQVVSATPDGLVLFDPARVRPSTRQPPLMIERVGVRRGESGLDLTHVEPLVVADGDRDLHIVARMLSFADSDASSYRFKLSGYDPDWIDVGPSGERLFSRLPSGPYSLEVQGKTVDGVWSKVRTLEFRVAPPWWRSSWGIAALALLGLLAVLVVVQLYRRRLRRLHAWQLAIHKQELAEQASLAKTRFLATLGHEVRTPMTGVMGMSELLLNTSLDARQRGYTEAIRRAGAHLLRLAEAGTPRYVYHLPTVRERARSLMAIPAIDQRYYAIKANSHPAILEALVQEGFGLECVSHGELRRVFDTLPELSPRRVLFTPSFAPKGEYEAGFALGVTVTLDNVEALRNWPEVFRNKQIWLRIDLGHGDGHHEKVNTGGKQSKFGLSASRVDEFVDAARALGITITGLHAHLGSGVETSQHWRLMFDELAGFARRIGTVEIIDIGGGLPIPYSAEDEPFDLERWGAGLAEVRAVHPAFRLAIEPGRFLVAESGVLLAGATQVIEKDGVHRVGLDAGMNTLIRPALYDAWHDIENLSRLDDTALGAFDVVGPICESSDVFGKRRQLPVATAPGDVMLVADAGAYGYSMASTYNQRELPREDVIDVPAG